MAMHQGARHGGDRRWLYRPGGRSVGACLGADVVVVEREARVLARVASPPLAEFFHRHHTRRRRAHRPERHGGGIRRQAGRVAEVRLSDGAVQFPATQCWSASARRRAMRWRAPPGLSAPTASSSIWPRAPPSRHPRDRRLHPSSATALRPSGPARKRAQCAGAGQAGRRRSVRPAPPAPEVPWFWSDQYDVRLQIAGLPFDVAETVVRGDPATGSFAIFHLARRRHRSGRRSGQRAGGIHGRTHDDRPAQAGGSGEAARRVMLHAGAGRL